MPKRYLISFTVEDNSGLSEGDVAFSIACALDVGLQARNERERFTASGLNVKEHQFCAPGIGGSDSESRRLCPDDEM